MEFPDNAHTNVYLLTRSISVEWSLYTLNDPPTFGQSEPQHLGVRPEDVPHIRIGETLEEAANALRTKGYHSLFDVENLFIWIFKISGDSGDEAQRQSERAQLTGLYGLTVKATGAIRSSDLSSISGSDVVAQKATEASQMSSEALKKLNMQAFENNAAAANGSISPSLARDDVQITSYLASIYTRFLKSISLTLITSICADGRWLRLGSKYVIGRLSYRDPETRDLKLERSRRELSLLKVAVKWYPSGALTATMCRAPAKELCQVSAEGNYKSTFPSVGSVVLLAPSGKEAIFVGHILRGNYETKTSIAARLRHQNIKISPEDQWVQIRYMNGNARDLPVTMIWPACLCFSISGDLLSRHQEDNFARTTSIDEWLDPLEAAENWYNERSARAQAVEARRRTNERLAEEARNNNDSEDEDMFIYDDNLLNGRLNIQDASGVYPTPPDGAPPHLHPTASIQEQPSQIEGGAHTSMATQIEHGDSSLVASPKFNEDPSFDNEGDRDHFGEFDSEVFAANGLTEDDFNFFDEQDTGELEVLGQYKSFDPEEPPLEADNICSTPRHSSISSHNSIFSNAGAPLPSTEVPLPVLIDNEIHNLDANTEKSGDTKQLYVGALSTDSCMANTTADDRLGASAPNDESYVETLKDLKQIKSQYHGGPLLKPEQHGLYSRKVDQKYDSNGCFGFENIATPEGIEPGKISEGEKLSLLTKERSPNSKSSPDESSIDQATDLESESESESDDTAPSVLGGTPDFGGHPEPGEYTQATHKRKRERSLGSDVPITPSNSHNTPVSPGYNDQASFDIPELTLFTHAPLKLPTELSNMVESQILQSYRSSTIQDPRTYLQVAQVLVDQIAHCNIELYASILDVAPADDPTDFDLETPHESFETMLGKTFPGVKQSELREIISAESSLRTIPTTKSNAQSTSIRAAEAHPNSSMDETVKPFRVQAPFACVRRMDSQIDIAVSALQFWEGLGLAPASTEKNVIAYCIHPESKYIEERVVSFLESVKWAYQCCKLGKHQLGTNPSGHAEALTAVPVNGDDKEIAFLKTLEACEALGRKLAASDAEGFNFVIYIVNTSSHASDLPRLCKAYLKIFECYASSLRTRKMENPCDMILQILPLAMIASNEKLIIPSPATYQKVAFEVYSRCAPCKDIESAPYACAPAVQLAGKIPRTIDFSLTSTPTANLSHVQRCVHVAYHWNPLAQWLSASWTDNQGCQQWNACYRIASDRTQSWPTFEEAAKEIWDTTTDMIDQKSVSRRVFIVKGSSMSRRELNVWLSIVSQQSLHKINVTLLAIEEFPDLQLPSYASAPLNLLSPALATPISTPTANFVSPEQTGYPLTPGAAPLAASMPTPNTVSFDNDHDTRLVDVAEETWGFVLGTTSSDSTYLKEDASPWCSALLRGHLMKRAGVRDEDGLVNLQVDMLHAHKPSPALLKEILEMYGSLGTLARIRGIVDTVKSVLPWHLAMAKKSLIALQTMRSMEEIA